MDENTETAAQFNLVYRRAGLVHGI